MRRILVLALCTGAAWSQTGGQLPSEAELAAAQPALVRALVCHIRTMHEGSAPRAAAELLGAAYGTADDATRYLLWREAVAMAEGADELQFAHSLEIGMAAEFGLEPATAGASLVLRSATSGHASRAASAALLGLQVASEHVVDDDERAMLTYYDAGTRAALACENMAVFTYVRDRLATLRHQRDVLRTLQTGGAVEAQRAGWLAVALTRGSLPRGNGIFIGQLQPALGMLGEIEPKRSLESLEPDEWLKLAEQSTRVEMRRALWRCASTAALLRLRRGGRNLPSDDPDLLVLHDQLVQLTDRLATDPGVNRLTFARREDRDHFAYANGDWRVEDNELRGASTGTNNFATLRVRYGTLRTVVIRGGIRSEAGLNFRCKVGAVNLLLNWEVADESHLWLNGQRFPVPTHVLQQGGEHTIAVVAEGDRCDVCIDGARLWTVTLPTPLAGTITVYPALGSDIFVREILIDGEPNGLVDAPEGVLM